MLQLTHHDVASDLSRLASVQSEFGQRQCVLLRRFVAPELLAQLLPLVEAAPTLEHTHRSAQGEVIARELRIDENSTVDHVLAFMFNRPALFRAIERLTGCPTIRYFQGRVYIMHRDAGHHDSWHSDNNHARVIGVSLNLSREGYSGGQFQIRERQPERILGEIHNVDLGDAHLFRIGPQLQHRVMSLTGRASKIAYAGWFHAPPDLRPM